MTSEVKRVKTTSTAVVDPSPTYPSQPCILYSATENNLQFRGITNDNSEVNLILLIQCKQLFSVQLPKMPREYIARLLFDRSHETICCLNDTGALLGAISVKPFPTEHFYEIAFCAVSGLYQVQGIGSLLMNHMKEYAKMRSFSHFLTYADNLAVGYFRKQGFTTPVTLAKPVWFGRIKDYDGGTLMECVVQSDVNYLTLKRDLAQMKELLLLRFRQTPLSAAAPKVFSCWQAHGKRRKVSDPFSQIPGLVEAGWKETPMSKDLPLANLEGEELNVVLKSIVNTLQRERDAWPFLEPVDVNAVPDYLDVIQNPMDLSVMAKKHYSRAHELRRDVMLMLDNCRVYNPPESMYYQAADKLEAKANELLGSVEYERIRVVSRVLLLTHRPPQYTE